MFPPKLSPTTTNCSDEPDGTPDSASLDDAAGTSYESSTDTRKYNGEQANCSDPVNNGRGRLARTPTERIRSDTDHNEVDLQNICDDADDMIQDSPRSSVGLTCNDIWPNQSNSDKDKSVNEVDTAAFENDHPRQVAQSPRNSSNEDRHDSNNEFEGGLHAGPHRGRNDPSSDHSTHNNNGDDSNEDPHCDSDDEDEYGPYGDPGDDPHDSSNDNSFSSDTSSSDGDLNLDSETLNSILRFCREHTAREALLLILALGIHHNEPYVATIGVMP
ncbi:dentin sialophosphoprotein-like [Diachasma alloeum]|uniref:dentin sialophosphoprotein-like n=1 Tax=Diachasma alloeum TaxID=454923 RepID=UPI00073818B7|nr:dentin sialophosphoprotein-like [Diachasma alloeum]